ncbi:MAG: DUF819 family protein [Rhodothermaceae bacterium]|nr:DUF819 family protein [Rhodothermaceae bacterium]MXZ56967.1 DUF819 family protein [Rhodothermaceae bacterium]MYB90815.1 DUF819 family protein [Rhodothermaceae bacterium]MYD67933.1 DUF819 family protein [Rhodothermaceae bacterium]MYG45158.1 DUF819 family protein [Rhodothermaceae bacterium]
MVPYSDCVFGLGVLFQLGATALSISSQVNMDGPTFAMVLATARGAADRVFSGVAMGFLGYAVGMLVREMLGYRDTTFMPENGNRPHPWVSENRKGGSIDMITGRIPSLRRDSRD